MNFKFNKNECRDGMEKACLENLLEAVRSESILKREIDNLKNEIIKRELKLRDVADARAQIFKIHEELHNETQLPWSPCVDVSIGQNGRVPEAEPRRRPPIPMMLLPVYRKESCQNQDEEYDGEATFKSPQI